MLPSVYVESTIPSFIVGELSPVLVTAARQLTTRQWWNRRRLDYRLYGSRLVREEVARGKPENSSERLALIDELAELAITDQTLEFAETIRAHLGLTDSAASDTVHVAVASQYQMDYLVTWNLKHIANANVRRALDRYRLRHGIYLPTICTPDELTGGENDDD